MSRLAIRSILTQTSPGEFRALACAADGQPMRLFCQRWSGIGDRVRYGTVREAHLRAFAEEMRGAFCELDTGETAFLRLPSQHGLADGQRIRVRVESEARFEKHARVTITDSPVTSKSGFEAWCETLAPDPRFEMTEAADTVAMVFDQINTSPTTLSGGGKLHIERTRALTACDIDTAGRRDKGSAGARALAINRDAIRVLAQQIALRGLGGAIVLDCVGPLNAAAGDKFREYARQVFAQFGLDGARILKPSPLGLLQISLPWQWMPMADMLAGNPAESELLDLFRDVQRQAAAERTKFFSVALGHSVWSAYLERKQEADQALQDGFSGRVSVTRNETDKNEVRVQ
ncbi:MAG: ribonuclease E/G [Pseudomonadota bacterium]